MHCGVTRMAEFSYYKNSRQVGWVYLDNQKCKYTLTLITMASQNSTPICHHTFAALKRKLGSHKFRDDHGVESIGTRQKTTQEMGS